ncbi:MAG: hypothetical protein Kow0092_34100 [Deferrisomatales bacterium]
MSPAVRKEGGRQEPGARVRRVCFGGTRYVLFPIEPERARALLAARCETALPACDPAPPALEPFRCRLLLAAAAEDAPRSLLGFYAVGYSQCPELLDETFLYVVPRARGRRLSHLLIYGVYSELLGRPGPLRLSERVDHPRLRLHARCGFGPPVRRLVDGKVEVGRSDLHVVLSRIEAENDLVELSALPP